MRLYVDLYKAVQIPSTSTDRVEGDRAAREYKESFNRRGSGALGGDPTGDDPNVGGKWPHAEGADENKLDSEVAAENGVTRKSEEAVDILKSFSSSLREQVSHYAPNEREVEYLTTVRGYDVDDVMKGRARIVGSERSKFNDWLHQRLRASINRLAR